MCANKFTPHNVTQYSEIGMNWSPPPKGYNVDAPDNYFKLYDWDFTEFNRDLKHYVDEYGVNQFTLVHTNPSVIQRFKHLPGKEAVPYRKDSGHISLAWQTFRETTIVGYNKLPEDDFIEISQDQYDRLLLDFYGTIAGNLEKNGWLDYATILVDETHYRGWGEYVHFLKLLQSHPLTKRIKAMWTLQGAYAFNLRDEETGEYVFQDILGIWVPEAQENYQWWEKYYFTDYGIPLDRERLWTYVTHTTRVAIDSPGINNRQHGLDVFNTGGGGYLCWASFMWDKAGTGAPTSNPWIYPWTRWANGAMSFFYPPDRNGLSTKPDYTITPSLRVMTYREGVDDFEYAWLLEQLLKKAKEQGVDAAKQQAVYDDISRFFYSTMLWSQNDEWYLDLRHRIARAVVELQSQVN